MKNHLPMRPFARGPFRALAFALLGAALPPSLAAADDASALHGEWRCEGGNDDVSFDFRWSLWPSGDYTDASRVLTRQDMDGDGNADEVVLESVERGKWSLEDDGRLKMHVTDLEVSGMAVGDTVVPLDSAREMMADTLAGAVGRVTFVPFETSSGGEQLALTIGGLEASCVR